MQHDYYRVLGVDPNASFETIRDAYRQRAMQYHPDRGGSHEQMVLINEAWEILSDSERRQRYDAVRLDTANLSVRAAATADAQQARQQAEQYPRRWADFEVWMNGVARDFTEARRGSVRLNFLYSFPTVENSVSGKLFILIGSVLFFGLGIILITSVSPYSYYPWHTKIFRLFVSTIAGGWIGAIIHMVISTVIKVLNGVIKRSSRKVSQHTAEQWEQETHRAQTQHPKTDTSSESEIIVCGNCGQKLRVPIRSFRLLVKCRRCRHEFYH